MVNNTCVVQGCTSDSRKLKNINKYPWMQDVTFIPFPILDLERRYKLRTQWLQAIQREDYIPNAYSRVCSLHWKAGRPTPEHRIPHIFPWNQSENPDGFRFPVPERQRNQPTKNRKRRPQCTKGNGVGQSRNGKTLRICV